MWHLGHILIKPEVIFESIHPCLRSVQIALMIKTKDYNNPAFGLFLVFPAKISQTIRPKSVIFHYKINVRSISKETTNETSI